MQANPKSKIQNRKLTAMPHFLRNALPYIAGTVLIAALVWATSFGTLPPADFTFDNGTEIETIDPSLATGQPENRIINGLFEGLLRHAPRPGWETVPHDQNVEMTPGEGMATHFELSEPDGKTYTFHLRPDARWTNDDPVTAHDFVWSWRRTLHPETPGQYPYQLYYIAGAEAFNKALVEPGNHVEVELPDRLNPLQLFPQGTIERGIARSVHKPPEPKLPETASDKERDDALAKWKREWVYVVEIKPRKEDSIDWAAAGVVRHFAKEPGSVDWDALTPALSEREREQTPLEKCLHVLPDFATTVAVHAEGPLKLIVTLNARTPFFTDLVAFYPLYPVNQRCIEEFGSPDWTRPANIVTNGPFKLEFRRIRDRLRLVKNEEYWDAKTVKLETIDALAVKSETTALNMYLNGQLDWMTQVPVSTIPILKDPKGEFAGQFRSAPMLTTYFYRINVTRPELRDKRVRRALAMGIDRHKLCEQITRAGEQPATSLDPPGMAGYESPLGAGYDLAGARKLLEEAGYAGGRGLPTIEILYNEPPTTHRVIAEAIQQMWRENLGIDVELRGLEWGVYLSSQHKLDYEVCRAAWVADYPDPNTFLDMFVTGGGHNNTGWSNARYDELIKAAALEPDPAQRMQLFQEAETILLDELPIIPIYFYVSKNLVSPRVKGFFNNVQDEHPLKLLRVEK